MAEKLVKSLRIDKIDAFRKSFVFNVIDVFNSEEQPVLESINKVFVGEHMPTRYSVLGYRIDLYFHKYKLAIEFDKYGHCGRDNNDEKREEKLKEKL